MTCRAARISGAPQPKSLNIYRSDKYLDQKLLNNRICVAVACVTTLRTAKDDKCMNEDEKHCYNDATREP